MRIDGKTRLVGIVGHPLDHTLSPAMHNAAFEALGLDYVYVPFEVAPSDFHMAIDAFRALGLVGFNVTMPYKEQILDHLDEVASYAQIAGAANTVQATGGRLVGYNTDGRGFIAALERDAGFEPKEKKAVVIGAGGAACAGILSLCLAGAASVTIVNRSPERAQACVSRLQGRFEGCRLSVASPFEDLSETFSSSDLVVNATPVGMLANPGMPVPAALLSEHQLVIDMIYDPAETEFLAAAKNAGARTMNGLGMLVYQGASSFEIWTEREAPTDVMRRAAEEALAALPDRTSPEEVTL